MIPVKIREGKLATFRKGNENWSLKWAISIIVFLYLWRIISTYYDMTLAGFFRLTLRRPQSYES